MNSYIGKQFGNYRLEHLLGKGGYAQVYLGTHEYLGTQAAVKVLSTNVSSDEEFELLLKEARVVARLDHEHIVKVWDIDKQELNNQKIPYLVMEYAGKGTLATFLPKGKPNYLLLVATYIKQIAAALQFAHEQNLIHCDVKPANILIFKNDIIKLSDFGIALVARSTMQVSNQTIVGTPAYMSPEQIKGKPVFASDQYALGIMAYEWLSGDVPFHGSSQEICTQHLQVMPPSLAGIVPPNVEEILLTSLQKDPQRRFSSTIAFAESFEHACQVALDAQEKTVLALSMSNASVSSPSKTTVGGSQFLARSQPAVGITSPAVTLQLPERAAIKAQEIVAQYAEITRLAQLLNRLDESARHNVRDLFNKLQPEIDKKWGGLHHQAVAHLQHVEQMVEQAQNALSRSKWRTLSNKNSSLLISSSINQSTTLTNRQASVEWVSKTLIDSIMEYNRTNGLYLRRVFATVLGTLLLALLYWLYTLLAHLLHLLVLSVLLSVLFWIIAVITIVVMIYLRNKYTVELTGKIEELYSDLLQLNKNAEFQYAQRQLRLVLDYYNTIYADKYPLLIADWDDRKWDYWQPRRSAMPPVARYGVTSIGGGFPAIPTLVVCPGRQNIIFEVPLARKDEAVLAIQSFMLRLLIAQPPGKLRFTLIDPASSGDYVAPFLQLKSYGETLIGSRVWARDEDIEQQLNILSIQIDRILQERLLADNYATLDDYNAEAGVLAEPYQVLVVIFPISFTGKAIQHLQDIMSKGPRSGVITLLAIEIEQKNFLGFNLNQLERSAKIISLNSSSDGGYLCDTAPGFIRHLLMRIGEKAEEWRKKVEFPYRQMAEEILPQYSWWSTRSSTAEGIRVPLGPISAKRYQYVEIGKGPANHMLILGTTGTGKTNFLHVLITGLALIYSPDELEMYLVDFKVVSFPPYVENVLPHASVVAIHAEQEFGMSVLRGVVEELHRRQALFKAANVGKFTDYRRQNSLPRFLLIIDEFQDLFNSTDEVNQEAENLLVYLVREGQGLGIHVILASQTLIGGKTHPPSIIVPRTLITQMVIRIALNVGTMDAGIILDEHNPMIPLLPTFREGEALYNNQHGATKGNYPFQCALLPEDDLRVYLTALRDLAKRYRSQHRPQQTIFDGSKNGELSESQSLNEVLQIPTWSSTQPKVATIWVGSPVALKKPTYLILPPGNPGSNLLIIGRSQDSFDQQALIPSQNADRLSEVTSNLLTIALLSLAAQYAPSEAHFYVLDFRSNINDKKLENLGKWLPHSVEVIHQRNFWTRETKSRNLADIIEEVYKEVESRKHGRTGPLQFLLIYGLQWAYDLRPDWDNTTGAPSSNLAKCFSMILSKGPEVGIHSLVLCDTFSNLKMSLEQRVWRQFDIGIAFHMGENESIELLGLPIAKDLKENRALLFRRSNNYREKFIPYDLPLDNWFYEAIRLVRNKK